MPANPLNTDDFGGELYNLAMSEKARPLLERVKAFIRDEVEPASADYFALGAAREDRWSYAPGQLEILALGCARADEDGVVALAKQLLETFDLGAEARLYAEVENAAHFLVEHARGQAERWDVGAHKPARHRVALEERDVIAERHQIACDRE